MDRIDNPAKAFYEAFSKLDSSTMNSLYSNHAEFEDPVFGKLNQSQTCGMWTMLCTNARNFHLEFDVIESSDQHALVSWVAIYDFSKTDRRVRNEVLTHMKLSNGLIVHQVDTFNFHKWARQAFGTAGLIMGFLPAFQKKVQKMALAGLDKDMLRRA